MTDTKKTRAPRQMTAQAIKDQISKLPILDKIDVFNYTKKAIDDEKKWHESQITLITSKGQ